MAITPASPQADGTTLTLSATASGSGCTNPQYEFWIYPSTNSGWQVLQSYSSTSSYSLNSATTYVPAGLTELEVWVRQAGSPNSLDSYVERAFTFSGCSGVSLTAVPASSADVGTQVTLSASSSGCPDTPQYVYWVLPQGGSWQVLYGWGSDATIRWDTTNEAPGSYTLTVWVRSVGSTAVADQTLPSQTFTINSSSSSAPAAPALVTPANGATNQSKTLTLTWSAPTGANSSTTYTAALWDPAGPPDGHLLGYLNAGTKLSVSVPASEQLLDGQSYQWSVFACNGTACSGFNAAWPTFTVAVHTAPTASGAIPTFVVNGDFSGHPTTSGTVPGWTGSASFNGSYVPGLVSLQSSALNLDFSSAGSEDWFRIGYRLQSSGDLTVTWENGSTNPQVFDAANAGSPCNTTSSWEECFFAIPSADGATGSLLLQGTSAYPDVAYVERLDTPSGRGMPRLGITTHREFPMPATAHSKGGIDLASGAYEQTVTDLSLAGLSPNLSLDFTRAYSSQAVSDRVSGGNLDTGLLGPKWSDTWDASLTVVNPGETVIVRTPSGPYAFNWDATHGVYVGEVGVNATLQLSGSTWQLSTFPDDNQYNFTQVGDQIVLTSLWDRNGNQTTLTYDTSHRLSTITDAGGRSISLVYDTNNRVHGLSDSASRSVTYGYDATTGDLTTVTDVRAGTTSYSYDGQHWLTSLTDQNSHTALANTYDQSGRVTQQLDPGNGTTQGTTTVGYGSGSTAGITTLTDQGNHASQFYFDQATRVTDVVDASGNPTSTDYGTDNVVTAIAAPMGENTLYQYDLDDNVTAVTDGLNHTWRYAYDCVSGGNQSGCTGVQTCGGNCGDQANLDTVTDPLGNVTTFKYDNTAPCSPCGNGNLTSRTDALGQTTTYSPNSLGQLTAVTDPLTHTTRFGYDATTGDLTTVTDPLGNQTTTSYDSVGRPTTSTDPLGHMTTVGYDAAGHVTSQVADAAAGGLQLTTSYSYDAVGNQVSVTDPNNQTTAAAYDPSNRLINVCDASSRQNPCPVGATGSGVTSYGYNATSNLTSITDANGNTTTGTVDMNNRPLTLTEPGAAGNTWKVSYDAAGRVATSLDANGTTLNHAYDQDGRLVCQWPGLGVTQPNPCSGSGVTAYSYDADGNRLTLTDSTGTTRYGYDALNRLVGVSLPSGKTVRYGYDGAGNRTSISYPNGQQVTYGYDARNELTSVTDWNNLTTSYGYDNAGRAATLTLPGSTGITGTYVYDNANRLGSIVYQKSGTTVASATYTLDAAGNLKQKAWQNGAGSAAEGYGYNALNQLTCDNPSGAGSGSCPSTGTAYSYDPVGNLLSTGPGGGTPTASYGYGVDNRLGCAWGNGPEPNPCTGTGTTSYSSDANGNLTARGSDSFTWDAQNRLTSFSVGGTASTATYNGDGLRQSLASGTTATSYVWDLTANPPLLLDDGTQYVYGLGRAPLEHITGSGTFFALADEQGTTLAAVDTSGAVVANCSFDAYGNVRANTGSQVGECRYAGVSQDPSGLYYLQARYYDPSTGRFVSEDPAGSHSSSEYAYVNNNPTSGVDPSGLCQVQIGASPITSTGGIEYHLSLVTTDTNGVQTSFQAFPQNPGPFGINSALSTIRPGAAGNLTVPAPSGTLGATQLLTPPLATNDQPCTTYGVPGSPGVNFSGGLAVYSMAVNGTPNLYYNGLSTNSNTFVYNGLPAIGVAPPDVNALAASLGISPDQLAGYGYNGLLPQSLPPLGMPSQPGPTLINTSSSY